MEGIVTRCNDFRAQSEWISHLAWLRPRNPREGEHSPASWALPGRHPRCPRGPTSCSTVLPHSLRDQTLLKLQVKGFLNRSAAGSAPERGRSPRLSPVWLCWQWQNLAASPCWSATSQAGLRFQGHVKAHLVQGMSAPAASRDPCRSRGSWGCPVVFSAYPSGLASSVFS